jgi:hypothetical protein
MNTPTWSASSFIDNWREWSADEIEKYTRWSQRRNDYSSLLKFNYSCKMLSISWNDRDFIELNKTLEEKWDVLLELPPYITHAWQWLAVYKWIQKLIESNIGDAEKLEKLASNVHKKWEIMLAREEFKRNTKNALANQFRSFVNWADWNEYQIQEYRESPDFGSDYIFLRELYLKLKTNLEFNESVDQKILWELKDLLTKNQERLLSIPVHALDKTFRWNSLYSICYNLSEKLPEDQKMVIGGLVLVFDQNGEFQYNQK